MDDPTDVRAMSGADLPEVDQSLAQADAFRRLADRHIDTAYRLASVILGDRSEAEDATHDAFVIAWRKWSTLRDPALFERWFDRILVNTCRNRLQRMRRSRGRHLWPTALAASDTFGQIHDRDLLGPAIARLSPDHRVVVALRFYRDMTLDEIAFRLALRPGTVKSRLHYALKQLHSDLERSGTGGQFR